MKSFLGMYAFENAFSAFKWLRYSPCCNALHTNRPPPSHRNVFVCALSLFWFGVLQAQIFEIALENVWLTLNSAWSRTLYRVSVCVDFSFVRVWVGGCHKITSSPLKIPMIFFLCLCIYLPTSAIEPAIKVMKRVATRSPSFPSNRKSTTDSMGMLSSCKISTFTCN